MNIKHFVAMLRYECQPRVLFGISLFPLLFVWQSMKHLKEEHLMFSLQSSPTSSFALLTAFFALNALFLNGVWGMKYAGNIHYSSPEFFFSRAICRRSQFCAKTCLYLFFAMVASLVLIGVSYTKPSIKLELPYNTPAFRERVKQFYLTEFKGATLEKDMADKEGNKFYVVLPDGQVHQSAFAATILLIQAQLLQAGVFLFWRKPWCVFAIYLCFLLPSLMELLITVVFFSKSTQRITLYENSLAWTTHHPLMVLLILAAVTVALQSYCCNRFIHSEVES